MKIADALQGIIQLAFDTTPLIYFIERNPKYIGLKATTNEHLGFVGREEGIAAMAVASVQLPDDNPPAIQPKDDTYGES